MALSADELASEPVGRKICDKPMVFYRDGRGEARALDDFCPHRGAPLSRGFIENGRLVCGYHGLRLDCDGAAHSMPGQRVERFPRTRCFPVVEYAGFVWVWPGAAEKADPALLPKLPWADSPDWAYGGGLYHVQADYRLMIDNLMDLTHETYVHADSIGQKEIDEAPVETSIQEAGEVVTSRHMTDIQAPPFWRANMRSAGWDDSILVDRWQVCRFSLPSQVMIDVGVAKAGRGGYRADAKDQVAATVVDFLTPETPTSHWYFWGMARRFQPQDIALTEAIKAGQGRIFAEDMAMLEGQQANLLQRPEQRLLSLNIDAGGVRARMAIINQIKAANASPA